MAMIISWFETNDVFQRFSVLFLLVCLFGYTTNIVKAFEHTYSTLIGFYLTARLYMVAYLALAAYLVPTIRGATLYQISTSLLTSALWIGSIYVDWPDQLVPVWIALFGEISVQVSYLFVVSRGERMSGDLKVWYEKWFQFWPGKMHMAPCWPPN
jgi:low temperature requirement protein LtrA